MTLFNKSKNPVLLFPVILLLSYFLIGWADSWEQIKRESEKITSVSARFTQKKQMPILARPLVSEGCFYFQQPDSVRWEYFSPVHSVMLMHKGNARRYIKGDKGFVEDPSARMPAMRIIFQEITAWSRGEFDKNKSFKAELKPGKAAKIILTPKDKGLADMIRRIEITLSAEKAGAIKTILIVEGEKSSTTMEFKDVVINGKIGESLFLGVQ
jgi:outer membrane lipoprotein-sorting protein